jgi:hypothetical protein
MFGTRIDAPYNIYRSLNRFVALLLKHRDPGQPVGNVPS